MYHDVCLWAMILVSDDLIHSADAETAFRQDMDFEEFRSFFPFVKSHSLEARCTTSCVRTDEVFIKKMCVDQPEPANTNVNGGATEATKGSQG